MAQWITLAKELGFLEPKSCFLAELNGIVKHLDTRASYLDPYIARNLDVFRFPQKKFPRAKSAISIALPYYHKPIYNGLGDFPRFSIYCQGRDYHLIFRTLLQEYLIKLKKAYPDSYFEAYSDTGPILDRAAAIASGLGYLGYNTCVIHPKYGSFIFLATVLTDLSLNTGDYIGSCKRCGACIKACPTGAIKEPFLVDNNICISALTQTKGFLSYKQCEMIQGHIFGCDICQLVCPHNRKLPSSSIITPFYELQNPELRDLIFIDSEYGRLIKQSAAGWRGFNVIRRNALIELAFSNYPFEVEQLKKVARKDPSHLVRAYSAFCIQKRTGDTSAWEELFSNAKPETVPDLKNFYNSVKDSC